MSATAYRWHKWAAELARHPDLSPSAKLTAHQLARHADNDTGECYPGELRLAAGIRRSMRTARSALRELKAIGAVTEKEPARQHKRPVYRLEEAILAELPTMDEAIKELRAREEESRRAEAGQGGEFSTPRAENGDLPGRRDSALRAEDADRLNYSSGLPSGSAPENYSLPARPSVADVESRSPPPLPHSPFPGEGGSPCPSVADVEHEASRAAAVDGRAGNLDLDLEDGFAEAELDRAREGRCSRCFGRLGGGR